MQRERTKEFLFFTDLLGTWTTEGVQTGLPFGPAVKVRLTETFEMTAGCEFVLHHVSGFVDGQKFNSVEVIREGGVESYYDDDTYMSWDSLVEGGLWVLGGTWYADGRSVHVRSFTRFNSATERQTLWQRSDDGNIWTPFSELFAMKWMNNTSAE